MKEETILEKMANTLGMEPAFARYALGSCNDPDSLYQKIRRYEAIRDAMELI